MSKPTLCDLNFNGDMRPAVELAPEHRVHLVASQLDYDTMDEQAEAV